MKIQLFEEFDDTSPKKYEYLIKLLEEYLDPENTMDDELKVKVLKSTNRTAQAQEFLNEMKLLQDTKKYNL
jgi:hypothetical protein